MKISLNSLKNGLKINVTQLNKLKNDGYKPIKQISDELLSYSPILKISNSKVKGAKIYALERENKIDFVIFPNLIKRLFGKKPQSWSLAVSPRPFVQGANKNFEANFMGQINRYNNQEYLNFVL